MVFSCGSRAVSARRTVSPPTPLSKTPMGASRVESTEARMQRVRSFRYFENGIEYVALEEFGTPTRNCAETGAVPTIAVASIRHNPAARRVKRAVGDVHGA